MHFKDTMQIIKKNQNFNIYAKCVIINIRAMTQAIIKNAKINAKRSNKENKNKILFEYRC